MAGGLDREGPSATPSLALIDESMRQRVAAGSYFLAVTRVPLHQEAAVRAELRALVGPAQLRFHWRAESRGRRFAMLDLLSSAVVPARSAQAGAAAMDPRCTRRRGRRGCSRR